MEVERPTTAVAGNLRYSSVTASRQCRNLTLSVVNDLASPTGFEPVLPSLVYDPRLPTTAFDECS